MVMLTVIGKKLAKEGMEFVFLGPIADCKECKVRNICFHLEKGTMYRIVSMRDKDHDCPQHEDGVRVVQVEGNRVVVAKTRTSLAHDAKI